MAVHGMRVPDLPHGALHGQLNAMNSHSVFFWVSCDLFNSFVRYLRCSSVTMHAPIHVALHVCPPSIRVLHPIPHHPMHVLVVTSAAYIHHW